VTLSSSETPPPGYEYNDANDIEVCCNPLLLFVLSFTINLRFRFTSSSNCQKALACFLRHKHLRSTSLHSEYLTIASLAKKNHRTQHFGMRSTYVTGVWRVARLAPGRAVSLRFALNDDGASWPDKIAVLARIVASRPSIEARAYVQAF
jgi:hypothetical protein